MSGLRLVLVRHGVTDWNREGRFQGHLDPPLSEAGRREARLAAERLASDDELRPTRVVSSTLGRAFQTAEAIAGALGDGIEVEPDPRLIEIGQGEWEGRTHAEIERNEPEQYREWLAAAGIRRPPGGEPMEEATARVEALLSDLLAADRSGTACLVSHGGTLRILARIVFGLGKDRSWSLDVDNAAIGAVTRVDGAWRLDRWNDARHLLGLERTHVDEAEGRPLAL